MHQEVAFQLQFKKKTNMYLFASIKFQLKTLPSSYEDFTVFEGHNGMKCFLKEHPFYFYVIHVSFIFTLSKKCMKVKTKNLSERVSFDQKTPMQIQQK